MVSATFSQFGFATNNAVAHRSRNGFLEQACRRGEGVVVIDIARDDQSATPVGCSPARSFPPGSGRPAGGSSPGATERASGRLAGDQPGGLRSPSGANCMVAWGCDDSAASSHDELRGKLHSSINFEGEFNTARSCRCS